MILKHKAPLKLTARESSMNSSYELFSDENSMEDDWIDQGEGDDSMDSPWEAAILYQRNPSVSHLEYCTTLERLGLGLLSTDVSRSGASLMGLRVTKCGGSAADCVFSNFSIVLSEEPIEEPETINMGVIYGQSKVNGSEEQEEDDLASVDRAQRPQFDV
ncbi:unnamed protein product [Lactuca virosa]|uniref:Uncharacterized protein n=1 Tax=Lactuca virosa TaxID=75947 RepID=A0AAU9PSC7_9ASTR|nr:unnamed protein product [Lactuca virosa]